MGIHLSHQPPTVVSMSTQVGVVGITVGDLPWAQVPLTLLHRWKTLNLGNWMLRRIRTRKRRKAMRELWEVEVAPDPHSGERLLQILTLVKNTPAHQQETNGPFYSQISPVSL